MFFIYCRALLALGILLLIVRKVLAIATTAALILRCFGLVLVGVALKDIP